MDPSAKEVQSYQPADSFEVKPPETAKASSHEVAAYFQEGGFPLNETLTGMLNDLPQYKYERFGNNYAIASYRLNDYIRHPRSDRDLNIFDHRVMSGIEEQLDDDEKDNLKGVDLREMTDLEKLAWIPHRLRTEGGKLLGQMIVDIIEPYENDGSILELKGIEEKLKIGACTSAESYFLGYLEGNFYHPLSIKNRQMMNVIVDDEGEPIMLEKIGLGESHSSLSLKPLVINGVRIPSGSLIAAKYGPETTADRFTNSYNGYVIRASQCEGFQFLRLSTLAISPENREEAFNSHLDFQKSQEGAFPGYDTAKIGDFLAKARSEVMQQKTPDLNQTPVAS